MYYYAATPAQGVSSPRASGLPLTPAVALRSLYEQWRSFEELTSTGARLNVYTHFAGAIRPPAQGIARPMGDPVIDAIADYACKVVARAGLLTSHSGSGERNRLDEYGRMTRQVFTAEHALAVDLARTVPDLPLGERETAARAVLALAAFWCDRDRLIKLGDATAHPLLGARPKDPIGAVLHQHAVNALVPRKSPTSGKPPRSNGMDLGQEITLAPAS